jgi:hypothetical protein
MTSTPIKFPAASHQTDLSGVRYVNLGGWKIILLNPFGRPHHKSFRLAIAKSHAYGLAFAESLHKIERSWAFSRVKVSDKNDWAVIP